MEYRGMRYTIRARIERDQWTVAIYPAGVEKAGKVISGRREQAELLAHSMIGKWLTSGKRMLKPRQNSN
jgi:hypothetical protein